MILGQWASTIAWGVAHPWALAAMVPALLVAWAMGRRQTRRERIASGLRGVSLVAGVLALSAPSIPLPRAADLPLLELRDVSGSTRRQRGVLDALDLPVPARRVLRFAASLSAGDDRPLPSPTRVGPALRYAAATPASAVIVHTDGQFADRWEQAAPALKAAGREVWIVPMAAPPTDARVTGLSARRTPDGAVELLTGVSANGFVERTLTITATDERGTRTLATSPVSLAGGDAHSLAASDAPDPSLAVTYEASLEPADAFVENDARRELLLPGRGAVALVADASPSTGNFSHLLPDAAPSSVSGWASYDAVAVVDAGGALLSRPQRRALAAYVRAGGGLVWVGAGPHDAPGDLDDPVNSVLPLVCTPWQRGPLDVAVLLDASGSMAERSLNSPRRKFDLAAQAVLSLRRHLTARDRLGVATFSDRTRAIYDGNDGPPDFGAVRDALARAAPRGPTRAAAARRWAAGRPVGPGREQLVLLVTDLLTEGVDGDVLAAALGSADRNLAVVAVAGQTDRTEGLADLAALARRVEAPLVRTEDLEDLADVFARFVRGARPSPLRPGPWALSGDGDVFGLAAARLDPWPAVLDCAVAEDAEVLARTRREALPILARRQAGLGRTVVLAAADRDGGPAGDLATTDLAGRAIRWVRRPAGDPRASLLGKEEDDGWALVLTVRGDSGPITDLSPVATLADEDTGRGARVPLEQTAPGVYRGRLASIRDGLAAVEVRSAGRLIARQAMGGSYPPEYARIGPDPEALRRLADWTGGRVVPANELARALRRRPTEGSVGLWPILLGLALSAMLIEWVLSRTAR